MFFFGNFKIANQVWIWNLVKGIRDSMGRPGGEHFENEPFGVLKAKNMC